MSEINLVAEPAELHMTLEIKRAATGKVEAFELIGHIENNQSDLPPVDKKSMI